MFIASLVFKLYTFFSILKKIPIFACFTPNKKLSLG